MSDNPILLRLNLIIALLSGLLVLELISILEKQGRVPRPTEVGGEARHSANLSTVFHTFTRPQYDD
ncbi:hypothetical protein C483_11773 [Natrialba hulunbeirensis JCM 10989]|uniref:Uncharacterized protein n=1 Tax=Natrialba hulunbeirensis JCM 10989 TaxID=1227493 RepID=L9ZUM2_9EURY|nr:hypothetical protein C483_11773 [Natrialba hulunbeirensis JCM 10989]OIB55653.1 hypothetical protein BBD46_04980 [Natrialba sp. SSL1]